MSKGWDLSAQSPIVNLPHRAQPETSRFESSRNGRELSLPSDDESFTFAVLGDRTGGQPSGVKVLAQAVDEINLLEPDLVMTVGDLVQGYNQQVEWLIQMREYRGIMDSLLMPWFPVAGNHDIYWRGVGKPPGEHESNYEQHFAPLWYAFEHKNAWFIVLYSDEGNPETGEKAIGKAASQVMSHRQLAWLKGTLEKTVDADHVFVFLHHPRWLKGNYGDDWSKVHEALVKAGNVKAVFAGHIHRMRYDGPYDGIEYITLATTGGSQSGNSPTAGNLDHFHMVTVREQQIAVASLPVGQTMNVREITGSLSDGVRKLNGVYPEFSHRFKVESDGSSDALVRIQLTNPADQTIKAKIALSSLDSRWIFSPDHLDRVVKPGATMDMMFRVFRWQDSLDLSWRNPVCDIQLEYLGQNGKFYPVKNKQYDIPFAVDIPTPSIPSVESVLELDGKGDYLRVDADQINLSGGPFTAECWLKAPYLKDHVSLISNAEGNTGFRLGIREGRPVFEVYLNDGSLVAIQAPEKDFISTRSWHHVAGVLESGEISIYLDGRRVSKESVQQLMKPSKYPVLIGAEVTGNATGTSFFAGRLDGVKISNDARYDGEFFTPARRQLPDRHTELLLNMDDVRVLWFYDESGNKAHPQVIGGSMIQAEL